MTVPVAGGRPVLEVDTNHPVELAEVIEFVRRSVPQAKGGISPVAPDRESPASRWLVG
jgi:hypothetical protein